LASRTPELVIFDCDGVLVDSEPISIAMLVDIITAAGGLIGVETAYDRFLGKSVATINEILKSEFDLVVSKEEIERIRAELYERLRRDLRPIPGVRDVLDGLSIRRCVASSSQPERIRLSLGVTSLLECFEPHIYSATMVKRGKPAPDLFLHAAREMRVEPAACVVIEDSPAGIIAAKEAGMRVFAFVGGSHAEIAGLPAIASALKPDLVFDDMRRLPALLARRPEDVR
jgi:HAD superfamily hydrolase (TIGR01509 family)